MVDIKDGAQSKQLAKLETKPKKNGDKIEFTYTRIDGDTPKSGVKASMFLKGLDTGLSDKLKSLEVGDEVVVVKTKKGEYWNMTSLEEASTFVAKPTYTARPEYKKSNNPPKVPFDNVGVKIGAARNQSIAFLAATKGTNFTLDDVDAVAMEIVGRQQKQEDAVRNGTTTETKTKSVDTKAPVSIDDVDDFDWS